MSLVLPADGRQSARALEIRRGTVRALAARGFMSVAEMPLPSGHRADLVALSRSGEIWIIEIKSSVADFRSDSKWQSYRAACDRLAFAVAPDFPAEILPLEAGLLVADGHGGALVREAPVHQLAAATRKALTLRFARLAAARLSGAGDPALGDPEAGL